MQTAKWLIVVMVGLCVVAGCGSAGSARFVNLAGGDGYDRGLVVCLSGAGAMAGEVDRFRQGLLDGGVRCAIESFEWSSGMLMVDQVDMEANKAKARVLARRIEEYRAQHPDCPVHLVGVSAGTGLIVWALEDLTPECPVDNVVLIASSLSQEYDLAAALKNVRGRLYSHYSPIDMVLAVGVPLTGTVDRTPGPSAGLHGFQPPARAGEDTLGLYDYRLSQVGWTAKDAALGHLGDHLGGTQPAYVRERIANLTWARQPAAPPAAQEPAVSVANAGGR